MLNEHMLLILYHCMMFERKRQPANRLNFSLFVCAICYGLKGPCKPGIPTCRERFIYREVRVLVQLIMVTSAAMIIPAR